jgi:hypothetical protein
MIEERKHGKQNNGHDNKECENRQNNFREDLHLQRVVAVTTRMPQSLISGQEEFICVIVITRTTRRCESMNTKKIGVTTLWILKRIFSS